MHFLRPRCAFLLAVGCALLSLFAAGCETPALISQTDLRAAQVPGLLVAGDVIKLTFPGAAELNQSQRIRADGHITLPLVGDITAAGKSFNAFQAELAALYRRQLRNEEVVVTLETSAIPVYVSGAVNRPGKIALDRPMTVLEGIMEAGGFSARANPHRVVLIRTTKQQHITQTFDLNPVLRGNATGVAYLRPYDVIFVQESLF